MLRCRAPGALFGGLLLRSAATSTGPEGLPTLQNWLSKHSQRVNRVYWARSLLNKDRRQFAETVLQGVNSGLYTPPFREVRQVVNALRSMRRRGFETVEFVRTLRQRRPLWWRDNVTEGLYLRILGICSSEGGELARAVLQMAREDSVHFSRRLSSMFVETLAPHDYKLALQVYKQSRGQLVDRVALEKLRTAIKKANDADAESDLAAPFSAVRDNQTPELRAEEVAEEVAGKETLSVSDFRQHIADLKAAPLLVKEINTILQERHVTSFHLAVATLHSMHAEGPNPNVPLLLHGLNLQEDAGVCAPEYAFLIQWLTGNPEAALALLDEYILECRLSNREANTNPFFCAMLSLRNAPSKKRISLLKEVLFQLKTEGLQPSPPMRSSAAAGRCSHITNGLFGETPWAEGLSEDHNPRPTDPAQPWWIALRGLLAGRA